MLVAGAILLLLLMAAFELALLVFLLSAVRNSSPAVMTPPEAVSAILEALELPENGLLLEPGCGDGRVLGAALRAQPGLRVLGVDNNPVLVALAWWRLRRPGAVRLGDARKIDYRDADRVFLYLRLQFLEGLETRLEQELKPGARVVSMHYALPKRRPAKQLQISGGRAYAKKLYIYEY